ncbi:MAG: bifunctional ornithine acetyltransferase/N-acetylglutamate synthase [Acidimicrobiales bacterium]
MLDRVDRHPAAGAHIVDAAPALVAAADGDPPLRTLAAEAIRTTDTFAKEVTVAGDGSPSAPWPRCRHAGAEHGDDAGRRHHRRRGATPGVLADVLRSAVDASFNVMTTDGCTSTNDTVLLLASGRAGEVPVDALRRAVTEACRSLAQMMVADAEGATKSVHLEVVGAADDDEAARGARKVADSNLCKCSWYGCDPYWGRVASELGSAGIAFDQTRISVSYGGHVVAAGGVEIDHDRAAVAAHMAQRDLHVVADLGLGSGRAELFTNDLTHAYVDENMGTS